MTWTQWLGVDLYLDYVRGGKVAWYPLIAHARKPPLFAELLHTTVNDFLCYTNLHLRVSHNQAVWNDDEIVD